MDIVYKIIFKSRIERNEPPFYYIGSKSNARVDDYKIFDTRTGKQYFGSSRWPGYRSLVKSEDIECHILYEGPDILVKEREYHIAHDVVASPEYFNLSLARLSSFSDANSGTYMHTITGKRVRLPTNHPKVLDGTYIGANTGKKASIETKLKMSKSRKGVKKTEEHKAKLAKTSKIKKGLVTLVHEDKERYPTVFVDKSKVDEYKALGYMNPLTLKAKLGMIETISCPHCGKSGVPGNMRRWHFDNCKVKVQNDK